MPWHFWLDVGGTFTDCLARAPDGRLLRQKVLSSAVVKGRAAPGSAADALIDPRLPPVPDDFWRGYTLRLLDPAGGTLAERTVAASAGGALRPAAPLAAPPPPGQAYELASPEDAPLLAIRLFLGLRLDEPVPPCSVRLGTTRGTNALLTRHGATTALVTTRGFADVLRIGYQNRPRLFDLDIRLPEPLYAAVAEIDERLAVDGSVLVPPREEQIEAELARLKAAGIASLAICLLHSYANPQHEAYVARIAQRLGFANVSTSAAVSPLRKIVPRGDTTVVEAYLNPVLRSYVERLAAALPGSDLRLMTSAGGLASPAHFTGKESILSGPAGGVVGFSRVAEAAGWPRAIGFDMGGTSTDVARFEGRYEYEFETQKAGVRLAAPTLAIETVAAGGGSICAFDGAKFTVGPESAGADPGPACYGRGGPLTVTDCNLYLGRLLPEHFPFALDLPAVERRLDEAAEQARGQWAGDRGQESVARDQEPGARDQGPGARGQGPGDTHQPPATSHQPPPTLDLGLSTLDPVAPSPNSASLAAGFLRIANANMAQAIRSISLARGYDPRNYVLVAFGAAAPQHACGVARELGITQILCHPDAGVLSALGIGLADVVKHRTRGVYRPLAEVEPELPALWARLADEARADCLAEGVAAETIALHASAELRYAGADAALVIDRDGAGDLATRFAHEHRRRYGYVHIGRPLEVVAVRVEAVGRTQPPLVRSARAAAPPEGPPPAACRRLFIDGDWREVPVYRRADLTPGMRLAGPAIIVEPLTTTIVDPGWQAEMLTQGELLLTDTSTLPSSPSPPLLVTPFPVPSSAPDPILLELFSNHLTAIATQMGITLRNTSLSVNVKERLDFSCAIFTAAGDLVVNAPHIPVHLGAMSETVKRILADNPDLAPGDVFVTNDPYRGGSHLPDVTVVTPVFGSPAQPPATSHQPRDTTDHSPPTHRSPLLFFTASRAHHAEIGGITPGSMPPFSKNLAEEGVLIRNFRLQERGELRLDELRRLLASGPYPSRAIDDNLADITAQLAANHQGAEDLRRLVATYSLPVTAAYMQHLQAAAERKLRAALARLPAGRREFVDHLDDGTQVRAAITVRGDRAGIDFTGTGPVSLGNLNANRAIVTAAVMYVLRLLVGEEIPLNQGVLAAVEMVLPEGLLNPPERERPEDCPAVVGGNVETSQRVVDVLLGALGLAAASQGTMNNVLFGDVSFGYYETICGGAGATPTADGADAVHTHMTNTRLTDPEVLEARFPVRLRRFAIRRGSGGAGAHRGGDGVIREIEFLRPLTLSILSQRRGPYPPYGLAGGEPGALGRNRLVRAGGSCHELPALVQTDVQPGDRLIIETPGGGGWGPPPGETTASLPNAAEARDSLVNEAHRFEFARARNS